MSGYMAKPSSVRLLRQVRTAMAHLGQRRLPDGRVSWRMLWPRHALLSAQRSMTAHALPTAPRIIYWPMQLILWAKWVTWHGWFAVGRALRSYGTAAQNEWSLPRWRQWLRLVRLSIGSGLPPEAAYQFGIMARPGTSWDYVSEAHVAAWHQWQNGKRQWAARQMAVLADKAQAAQLLGDSGVPMAPVHQAMARGDALRLTEQHLIAVVKRHGPLFCKGRSGQRGIGSFECSIDGGALSGRLFEGDALPDAAAVMAAWRALAACDDVLVQPVLRNHPQLSSMAPDGAAITVRCVTRRMAHGNIAQCAVLEIPAQRRSAGHGASYVILPIDISSGLPRPLPAKLGQTAEYKERQREALSHWPVGQSLPGWNTLMAHSIAAHQQFPDLWAIAWDWVLTPEGPVMLEGNSGFSGIIPQIICGGFLTWDQS